MFVIPGIVALVVFVYVHPQEVYEPLRAVTVPMLVAFAAFGYLLDVRVANGETRRPSLLLWLAIAFWGWAILTIAIAAPDSVLDYVEWFTPTIALFMAIGSGISTLRGLRVVTVALLSITMAIALIAIDQGLTPPTCILDETRSDVRVEGDTVVGRPCANRGECSDPNSDRDYMCEHTGLMKTASTGFRVRYRGVLHDPNELAWVLSVAVPFAFAWYERRRARGGLRAGDRIVVAGVLVAAAICNVMTQSRSGQISLVATLGVYFVSRFGWRGVAAGAVVALPILLLGGRSDESSTQERLECWAEALALWREHPLVGVGARQFTQHHYLTAHNSVLLALAEMGPIGLVLFTGIIYASLKVVLRAQRDLAKRPEAAEARAFAFATAAALVGTAVSALFLSIAYHVGLWIIIGLAGAVQAAVMRHDPGWRVGWRWRDGAAVIGLDIALVTGIALYLRSKGL